MSIDQKQVENIAQLAKLQFTDEAKERLVQELEQIVTYVDKLNELDVADVAPTAHVLALTNVFREDEVEEWITREEALRNAPAQQDGYFCVPKVINNQE